MSDRVNAEELLRMETLAYLLDSIYGRELNPIEKELEPMPERS